MCRRVVGPAARSSIRDAFVRGYFPRYGTVALDPYYMAVFRQMVRQCNLSHLFIDPDLPPGDTVQGSIRQPHQRIRPQDSPRAMPQSPPPSDQYDALATAVRQRRDYLCLSQRSIYAAGGPSPATLNKIENPSGDDPASARTLEKLDSVLQWEPGTSRRVLAGEITVEDATQQSRSTVPEAHDSTSDPLSPWSFILTLSQDTINYILDTYNLPDVPPSLHARGEKLVQQLSDHYTTMLLETYGGPNRTTPPLIQATIGGSLTADEPPSDSAEHERWLYRRWLIGMPVNDPQAERRFRRHWARRTEQPPE